MSTQQHFFADSAYQMVNINNKQASYRRAIAQGRIIVGENAFQHIQQRTLPKGDALTLAEIAGINGAKKAHETIPLCHPLQLEHVCLHTHLEEATYSVTVYCMVSAVAKTGVEMEALAGVNSALLAIYDLTKMVEPALTISDLRLLVKEGGKKGRWVHPDGIPAELQTFLSTPSTRPLEDVSAAVITLSDRAAAGDYTDKSGEYLQTALRELGCSVVHTDILPDNKQLIIDHLQTLVTTEAPQLIITTGGTGLAPTDVTPEAIAACCDKLIPGFGELLRNQGAQHTPYAWLSRSIAGIIQQTLIIALPGNPKAISESIDSIKALLPHALHIAQAGQHD